MENSITVTLNTNLFTKEIFKSLSLFVEGALRTRSTTRSTYQNMVAQKNAIEGSMRSLQAMYKVVNGFSDDALYECYEDVRSLLNELDEISTVYFERLFQ